MTEVQPAPRPDLSDDTGSRIGMWLFLLSEILLFGGMFVLYSVYRYKNPVEFHQASRGLDITLGTLNTIILLTSSLTIALSLSAVKKGNRKLSSYLLMATIFLGLFFLVNKSFEWAAKIGLGLYPDSPPLLKLPRGEILFYGLYYAMTGLHGIHVLIGVFVMALMVRLLIKGKIGESRFAPLENSALYWHLVDIIWIFLFPLFYLIS